MSSVSNFGADISGISRNQIPSQLSNINNEFEETKNFDNTQCMALTQRDFNLHLNIIQDQQEEVEIPQKTRDVEIQTDNNFGAHLKSRYHWTAQKLEDEEDE